MEQTVNEKKINFDRKPKHSVAFLGEAIEKKADKKENVLEPSKEVVFDEIKREIINETVDKIIHTQQNKNYIEEISVTKLPSNGVSYPKGWTITYKPFVGGELFQLSNDNLEFKKKLEILMEGINVSFDIKKLTLQDFHYLNTLRKISTTGDEVAYFVQSCAYCGEKNNISVSKENLKYTVLEIPRVPVNIKLDLGECKITPLTLEKYLEMIAEGKEDDEFYSLAKQVVGSDKSVEYWYDKFYNCNYYDLQRLNRLREIFFHGVEKIPFKCENKECGMENLLDVDGEEVLIMPFRSHDTSDGSFISFGNES